MKIEQAVQNGVVFNDPRKSCLGILNKKGSETLTARGKSCFSEGEDYKIIYLVETFPPEYRVTNLKGQFTSISGEEDFFTIIYNKP